MNNHGRTEVTTAARRELQFLSDPLKLAQAVGEKLRKSQFDAALNLVRESDRGVGVSRATIDNTVSWNHLIDWLMQQNQPNDAWKIYNEVQLGYFPRSRVFANQFAFQMKKRGHKPDAHTYTIMLRGYRDNFRSPNAVKQAINVYNSIGAPNSAVEPTVIHTNAVLNVCARALHTDSMWAIAGKLPERGPGAPDQITYTTILNAINAEVRSRAVKLGSDTPGHEYDPQPIFEEAVNDARKLWADITSRWRRGLLHPDEDLVCAMGRILLLSAETKSCEDVLNLVQQTMNIPKYKPQQEPGQDTDESRTAWIGAPEDAEDVRPASVDITPSLYRPMPVTHTDSSIYAMPGNNTLSMLMEATTALRQIGAGKHYWQLLTSPTGPFKLTADPANIASYMRLLRVSRASQTTLDLLLEPRPEDIQKKAMSRGTFTIAMSTCFRDKRNPNVFSIASRIFDLMKESADLEKNDDDSPSSLGLKFSPVVLEKYLQLALATTKGLGGPYLTKTRNGDLDFERDPAKNNTFVALDKLETEVANVKRLIKLHVTELEQLEATRARTRNVQTLLNKRKITPYSVRESMSQLIGFLRTLISAYDKILKINERLEDDGMGPLDGELIKDCWAKKRGLSAFLGKVENVGDSVPTTEAESGRIARTVSVLALENEVDTGNGSSGDVDADAEVDGEQSDGGHGGGGRGQIDYVPGQRTKALRRIESERTRRQKQSEERGLSRIQKRELTKEERIRAQFPASVLRPKERRGPGPPRKKKFDDIATRTRTRSQSQSQSRDEDYLEEAIGRRKGYSGWGGGFQDMARQTGHGNRSGFVDLGR
ncbi:hypothetical protein LTR41_001173 [Exophiala xenobiotica]|nr:hypothetical protein LTR41_001173 [Exophiala xenobiotica]